VDEAQDLNKSQLVMAKKACKIDDGRIVMVLDPYQALYSWRMADTSILEDLKQQSATKILPLPISYRCPKLVIDLAQNWVPDITCPDTAIQGEVKDISLNDLYKLAKPGCFILSRTNAPMVKICMSLIRNNVRANIRGRDIGKQLNYLIKKSKKKEIPAFLKWLENWKNEEVEKLKAKNFNTENVLDRQECLINLCDECKTLKEVSKRIDDLFNDTDEKNIVILSTVHRAKGLEREDVFLLRWTFRAWFDKMFLLEKPNEECNIAYVAATRSKKRLFVVQKPIV
jgi:superfamily I DNA/RNA helicase